MSNSYRAILKGDRLQWVNGAPPGDRPLDVAVTVLTAAREPSNQIMADALEELAARRTFASGVDPARWQREARQDRNLRGGDG